MINNRYTVLSKLGEGRSRVFCCMDKYNPGVKFAIKILARRAKTEEEDLFLDEYYTLLKLNHPNIIKAAGKGTVLKIDENEFASFEIETGSKFFVMEYFAGEKITEAAWLKDEGRIPEVISQICSVMLYLHHSNYVYGDLKAENILVAKKGNDPELKFIDFGLACNISEEKERPVSGTYHYLAPEVLQGKRANFQSDMFSLGVLLYRLVYGRFPFEGKTESEIFKSIMDSEPAYPSIGGNELIISIIKKLLLKNSENRYTSPFEILGKLKPEAAKQSVKQWSPAKVFIDRPEKIQINSYLNDDSRFDVLLLKGTEGSGKTALLESLTSENTEVIYIGQNENLLAEKRLLEEIIFHPHIYNKLKEETLEEVLSFIKEKIKPGSDTFYDIKLLLIKICSEIPLTIGFDDFSKYDTYTMISLSEVIQILQSKRSKVLIADVCCNKVIQENIHNVSEISLQAFSLEELSEVLNRSIPGFYPVKKINEMLSDHWDLTPGGVYNFLKGLYENEVFEFSANNVGIKEADQRSDFLAPERNENYKMIFQRLTENERKLLELCSMISINADAETCAGILGLASGEINYLIAQLKIKGMLQVMPGNLGINFNSERFKEFIYSGIENKKKKHGQIAEYLESHGTKRFSEEIVHQFENSGNYDKSFDILWCKLLSMQDKDSLKFQKEMLLKLSEFPVSKEKLFSARLFLCRVLQKLSENRLCLDLIEKYYSDDPSILSEIEFVMLEGICLIESGETEEGMDKIQGMITQLTDEKMKLSALLYLAFAQFDLGQYEAAMGKCTQLINASGNHSEFSAKGHNLLGLIEFCYRNDLSSAIKEFEIALEINKRANLPMQVAAVELNIGNIFNMQGDWEAAVEHWRNSLTINSAIGNLDQEAKLLLNFGIFYFDRSDFSMAVMKYKDAQFIFSNLGNRISEGLTFSNLGEVYLTVCNYTDAFKSLEHAKEVFLEVNSISELIEVEFLFGKYYFQIGDRSGLTDTIENLEKLIQGNTVNEKHKEYLGFLVQAKQVLCGNIYGPLSHLKIIKEAFYNLSDWNDFISVSLLISKILIEMNQYNEAVSELNDKRLEELSTCKTFIKAEREILLSIISAKTKQSGLCNKFEYLKNAYNLIENQDISEVTWKALFYMAESYFERGNLNKAGIFTRYASGALQYIADQLEDPKMREKYLSLPERKMALKRLKYIQEQI